MKNDQSKKKLKVIYCMGSGRSGSTVLGIILGNHPKILGPGELYTIHRLSDDNFECSCGERVVQCEFWSKVIKNWKQEVGDKSFELFVKDANSKVENFKSPISWFNMVFKYPGKSKYYKAYQEANYSYFKSIQEVSNKSIIVDISKNPLRALALIQNPDIDLRLIHLVRDGRGVAWSLNKIKVGKISRKIWRTAFFWLIVNKQSDYVRSKSDKNCLINYEELANNPEKVIQQISDLGDFDKAPIMEVINGNLASENKHIMEGNRLRKQKTIELKINKDWEDNMSLKKQNVFLKIAGRTMKKYGYS